MLTDKAKELFEEWLKEKDPFLFEGYNPCLKLTDLHPHLLNGYIIEWLDSLGFYIHIEPYTYNDRGLEEKVLFKNYVVNHQDIDEQNSYANRQSALTKAIEKVNQIINLKE